MAQFLKIYKKTTLSWWFEVNNNGESRTISDFEVNIGNSFNIVEIDGSKISIENISNITIIDETNANANFNYIDPFLLEQKLRALNFIPYRSQSIVAGFGIVDAPAIAGIGTTIMTFDEIRYHAPTNQTGNIVLQLNATPNINKNGRVQVLDINGTPPYTLSHLENSVNSNGVAFDNTKNNVIYYDNVNGKLKYNITLQDFTSPTLISATVQNSNPSNIVLTYSEALMVSPLPSFTDFALNLSKTVTAISIVGSVVTLTVNSPYAFGNLPTISYTAGVNKIRDLAGNNAANLVNQVITNSNKAEDNFNSANITSIEGRATPIGNYIWTKSGLGTGTAGIAANAFKNTGAVLNMDNFYTLPVGRNVDFSITYNAIGTVGSASIIIGYSTSSNMYYLNSALVLRKVTGAGNNIVSSIAGGLVNGDVVRVVLTDTTISVFKNGIQIYTGASDPAVTGTSAGVYIYQDNVVEFDNLIVY